MSLLESLFQGENSNILEHLKSEAGVTTDQLQGLTSQLLPKVTEVIQNSLGGGNLMETLSGLVSKIDMSQIIENPSSLMGVQGQEMGNKLLTTLFGSDDAVSKLMSSLSQNLSIEAGSLSKLLPALSTAVIALVMKQAGGLTSMLSSMFTQGSDAASNTSNNILDMAKGFLDKDGDGSVMDDLLAGAAKKFM